MSARFSSSASQPGARASSWRYPILAAGGALSVSAIIYAGTTLHSEDKPRYTKEEVSLLCMIGVPGAGKTTQAKKIKEKWPEFEMLDDINSVDKLIFRVTRDRRPKPGERKSYLVDGFPRSMKDVKRIESELVPVFCVLFHDLPKEKAEERFGKDSREYKEWEKAREALMPVVKRYRDEGNILEISSDWDDPNEVSKRMACARMLPSKC